MTETTQTYQLTGYSQTPTTATVTIRSFDKPERMRRALKGLGTFWAAALGSVFIPVAHFLLVPSFLLYGIYTFFERLNADKIVVIAEGMCPDCGKQQSGDAHLRQPEPQVAGETEVRNADTRERTRIAIGDQRRFLADHQLQVRPLHRPGRASQRKHPVAGSGLLAAEEIDVDFAAEAAAEYVGIGDKDAESRASEFDGPFCRRLLQSENAQDKDASHGSLLASWLALQ